MLIEILLKFLAHLPALVRLDTIKILQIQFVNVKIMIYERVRIYVLAVW